MKTPRFLTVIGPALIAVAMSVSAQDALVDDFDGDNVNEFGGWWMFGSDNGEGGNSEILNATVVGGIPQFTGEYTGGHSDEGYCGLIEYKIGSVMPGPATGKYANQVILLTDLVEGAINHASSGNSDYGMDLSAADGIQFYAKASQKTTVKVTVATTNITDWSYWQAIVDVGTDWELFFLSWSDFDKATWGLGGTFGLKTVNGIHWTITAAPGGKGGALNDMDLFDAEGWLRVDDVAIVGMEPPPPADACLACVSTPAVPASGLLVLDGEGDGKYVNALEAPVWAEALTDVSADSTFVESEMDESFTETGYGNTDGWRIDFTLGDGWLYEGKYPVSPEVMIKCFAQPRNGNPYDASLYTGIYFHYKTSFGVDYIRLYVKTDQIFGGNEGAIPYVRLPGTEEEWKSAVVPWSALRLPNWEGISPDDIEDLDISKLVDMRWAYMGEAGEEGYIAVDNVYLISPANAARNAGSSRPVHASRMTAKVVKGALAVSIDGNPRADISLVDMAGRTMYQASYDKGALRIPAEGLSDGVYVVRAVLRGDGRPSVRTVAVTIAGQGR